MNVERSVNRDGDLEVVELSREQIRCALDPNTTNSLRRVMGLLRKAAPPGKHSLNLAGIFFCKRSIGTILTPHSLHA